MEQQQSNEAPKVAEQVKREIAERAKLINATKQQQVKERTEVNK